MSKRILCIILGVITVLYFQLAIPIRRLRHRQTLLHQQVNSQARVPHLPVRKTFLFDRYRCFDAGNYDSILATWQNTQEIP